MTPRSDQEAPYALPSIAHNVTRAPPAISILFILPSATKPIDSLSGDQKGLLAPSVPVTARASSESRLRIQSSAAPSRAATNASLRPSGDIAGGLSSAKL